MSAPQINPSSLIEPLKGLTLNLGELEEWQKLRQTVEKHGAPPASLQPTAATPPQQAAALKRMQSIREMAERRHQKELRMSRAPGGKQAWSDPDDHLLLLMVLTMPKHPIPKSVLMEGLQYLKHKSEGQQAVGFTKEVERKLAACGNNPLVAYQVELMRLEQQNKGKRLVVRHKNKRAKGSRL